jgi:hypothetical protein
LTFMPARASDAVPARSSIGQRSIVDEWKPGRDLGAIRNVAIDVVIELPQTRERRERHVEFSPGPLTDFLRCVEDLADFDAHRDRDRSGSVIQPCDVASCFPCAHQRVEPIEFIEGFVEGCHRRSFVCRPRADVDLGAHAHARALDQTGSLFGTRRSATRARGEEADRSKYHDDVARSLQPPRLH